MFHKKRHILKIGLKVYKLILLQVQEQLYKVLDCLGITLMISEEMERKKKPDPCIDGLLRQKPDLESPKITSSGVLLSLENKDGFKSQIFTQIFASNDCENQD